MRSLAKASLHASFWLICFLPTMTVVEAFACSPGPYRYDTAADPSVVIATAIVVHQEKTTDGDRTCMRTSYAVEEVLLGSIEGPPEASVCSPNSSAHADDATGMEELGFVTGAYVLVGLTKGSFPDGMKLDWDSNYRYLYPSCWGPLHYNLERLSEAERRELIEQARSLGAERAQEDQ